MKKIVTPILIFITYCCVAQSEWQWVYNFDYQADDYIEDMVIDCDGNIYAICKIGQEPLVISGDTIFSHNGYAPSGILIKLDSDSNLKWVKTFAGTYGISESALEIDNEKNIYVAFSAINYYVIDTIEFFSETNCLNISKFDSNGNLLQLFQYPNVTHVVSLFISASKDIYFCGYCSRYFSLGDFVFDPSHEIGKTEVFVAKIDSVGNPLWLNCISGISWEMINDLEGDNIDNLYVVGRFESPKVYIGDTILINCNSDTTKYDIFIVKYNYLGDILWAKRLGESMNETGESITIDNDNNIVLSGNFESYNLNFNDTVLIGGAGCQNTFIIKFDNSFNRIWGKSFEGYTNNAAKALVVDTNGNTYVSGIYAFSLSVDGFVIHSLGGIDNYIARINTTGKVDTLFNVGGIGYELITELNYDTFGNLIIAGRTDSPTNEFGDLIIYNDSIETLDIFIAKFSFLSNIFNCLETSKFSIFPNPTSTSFTIKSETYPANVNIFDLNGKPVKSIEDYSGENIDVADLQKSVYFVKLIADDKISVGKLVVE